MAEASEGMVHLMTELAQLDATQLPLAELMPSLAKVCWCN